MEYDESYEKLENIVIPQTLVLRVDYTEQVIDHGENDDDYEEDIGGFDEQKIFIVNLKFAYSCTGYGKKIVLLEVQEMNAYGADPAKIFYAGYTNEECFYLPSKLKITLEEYLRDSLDDEVEITNIELLY